MPDIIILFSIIFTRLMWQSFYVYNLESKTYKILTSSATICTQRKKYNYP